MTQIENLSFFIEILPECYGNQNRKWLIPNNNGFKRSEKADPGISAHLTFGMVRRKKGIIQIVFPDEAQAIRAKQRRYQKKWCLFRSDLRTKFSTENLSKYGKLDIPR